MESLLNLEKTSRLAEDIAATKACCAAVLDVCYQLKDWKLLEEQIMLLSKRRSQMKQVCCLPGRPSSPLLLCAQCLRLP